MHQNIPNVNLQTTHLPTTTNVKGIQNLTYESQIGKQVPQIVSHLSKEDKLLPVC